MGKPFDLALFIAGLLSLVLVTGTILLAVLARPVPASINAGVLASLGFWFSKGLGSVITNLPAVTGSSTGEKTP